MSNLTSSLQTHERGRRKARYARLRRGKGGASSGRWFTPYLFLLVPVALLVTFTYLPVVELFRYSVTDWDGLSPVKHFVGLSNYVNFFEKPALNRVFLVSLYYMGASVIQMALALYFATLLSFNTRFKSFFKGMIFFPYLINGVAIAFIFLYFFQPGGTFDSLLSVFGVNHPPLWLGNPHLVNFSLAGAAIWRYMGLNFVLFLGAIQSIPTDVYEAAQLDGANRWHQFRYIIAPGIKPIISLSFILAVSGSLSAFEIPYVMLGGANGSSTFVIETVIIAFKDSMVGLASAMAVILLIIVLLVTWVQRKIVPDEDVNLS